MEDWDCRKKWRTFGGSKTARFAQPMESTLGGTGSSAILQIYDFRWSMRGSSTLTVDDGALAIVDNSTLRFNSYFRVKLSNSSHFGVAQSKLLEEIVPSEPMRQSRSSLAWLRRCRVENHWFVEGIATWTMHATSHRPWNFGKRTVWWFVLGVLSFFSPPERGVESRRWRGYSEGTTELVVPTNGEFRGRGAAEFENCGLVTGSTMTATGNWATGPYDAASNGFYTNGTLNTGQYSVTLWDANDAGLRSGRACHYWGCAKTPGHLTLPKG